MKQKFLLKCYNGYGETIIRKFEARNLIEANLIAKNFMTHNFLKDGVIITKSFQTFKIY